MSVTVNIELPASALAGLSLNAEVAFASAVSGWANVAFAAAYGENNNLTWATNVTQSAGVSVASTSEVPTFIGHEADPYDPLVREALEMATRHMFQCEVAVRCNVSLGSAILQGERLVTVSSPPPPSPPPPRSFVYCSTPLAPWMGTWASTPQSADLDRYQVTLEPAPPSPAGYTSALIQVSSFSPEPWSPASGTVVVTGSGGGSTASVLFTGTTITGSLAAGPTGGALEYTIAWSNGATWYRVAS